jgi:hypothetical protein
LYKPLNLYGCGTRKVPVSKFAFNFNLYRSSEAVEDGKDERAAYEELVGKAVRKMLNRQIAAAWDCWKDKYLTWRDYVVGLYTLTPPDPYLKGAWFQPLHQLSENLASKFAFQISTCVATT